MKQLRCAYLTMDGMGDSVIDANLSVEPMAALAWAVDMVGWQDTAVNWDDYDAVYICSPWDYPQRPDKFIEVLSRIDRSSAELVNRLSLVRWTLTKSYLRDLEARGAAIVPSSWYEDIDAAKIPQFFAEHETNKVVIKPLIGANAVDTWALRKPVPEDVVTNLVRVFSGRSYFVQPFIDQIQTEGEYSLFFFEGEYSHAILKSPKAGDFRVQEEHGAEIRSVEPDDVLISVAKKIISLVDPQPVYARADFVRGDSGLYLLMELELIEPSLYFHTSAGAAERFAAAFDRNYRDNFPRN